MKYLTFLTLLFASGCAGRLHIDSAPIEESQPDDTIMVIDEEGEVSYQYPRYYVEDSQRNRYGPFKTWRLTSPNGHHILVEDKYGKQMVFGGNFRLEER